MTLVPPVCLRPAELRKALLDRHCILAHANTPETSLSFLSAGALHSRKRVRELKLPQTPQYTDENDEKFGIFDSVFVDLCDLHRSFKTPNEYGPVSFRLNVERLLVFLENTSARLSITNAPPHTWTDSDTPAIRWIAESDIGTLFPRPADNSFASGFIKGWPSIVISSLGAAGLPLSVVDEIVVDNPPGNTVDFRSFLETASSLGTSVSIRARSTADCAPTCVCRTPEGYRDVRKDRLSLGAWHSAKKTG